MDTFSALNILNFLFKKEMDGTKKCSQSPRFCLYIFAIKRTKTCVFSHITQTINYKRQHTLKATFNTYSTDIIQKRKIL